MDIETEIRILSLLKDVGFSRDFILKTMMWLHSTGSISKSFYEVCRADLDKEEEKTQ